jgi:hypothetical protein
MKATQLLKKQHREVKALFKQVEGTDDSSARRRLMGEIEEKLKLHTFIEEEIFYPAVKELEARVKKAKEMVLEAFEEHHVVDLVLAELPKVDPAADTFEAKMTVLKELVEHHVQEEEHEMFPMAEKRFGVERSREIAAQMEQRAAAA